MTPAASLVPALALSLLAAGCSGACCPRVTTRCCPSAPVSVLAVGRATPPPAPPAKPIPAPAEPVVKAATSPEDATGDAVAGDAQAPPTAAPAASADPAAVSARSAAIRDALPAPVAAWSWTRELEFDGFRLGTFTIEAEPATLADKPVWYVLERTVREAGEGRVVSESSVYLTADLSLLRGETVLRAPGGTESLFFGRREGSMEVTASSGEHEKTEVAEVAENATIGLFPVIRVLEAAFAGEQGAQLPLRLVMFDPRHAFGDGEGKPIPAGTADVTLEPGESAGKTHAVQSSTAAGRGSTILVGQGSRKVESVRGRFPHWDLVPAGSSAKRPDWFDRVGQTPETAYQAFCNFGRGYHLAKRDLLESAFHWETMREHEIAAGTYPADVTLEKVKEDYIAEFLRMSKHRTAADCDDLVTQILVTSKITKSADGVVAIEALPIYGGHTFHCGPKDGRWWVLKVD
jgi:hypothetical protein